ncbi:putative N-acetyltransferase YhbS [Ereboglobus sp. PH5-5]|nr:putative N-acetyltransferase YhbS [Ereboglobus sp. PH5-5]
MLERFTRQGVGSRLLRHATGHAFAAGATAVWLSAWAGNQRAIDFYKKHNWLHVGETSFMLGAVAHPNHIFAIRKSQQRRGCAPRAGLPDSPHPG